MFFGDERPDPSQGCPIEQASPSLGSHVFTMRTGGDRKLVGSLEGGAVASIWSHADPGKGFLVKLEVPRS